MKQYNFAFESRHKKMQYFFDGFAKRFFMGFMYFALFFLLYLTMGKSYVALYILVYPVLTLVIEICRYISFVTDKDICLTKDYLEYSIFRYQRRSFKMKISIKYSDITNVYAVNESIDPKKTDAQYIIPFGKSDSYVCISTCFNNKYLIPVENPEQIVMDIKGLINNSITK